MSRTLIARILYESIRLLFSIDLKTLSNVQYFLNINKVTISKFESGGQYTANQFTVTFVSTSC